MESNIYILSAFFFVAYGHVEKSEFCLVCFFSLSEFPDRCHWKLTCITHTQKLHCSSFGLFCLDFMYVAGNELTIDDDSDSGSGSGSGSDSDVCIGFLFFVSFLFFRICYNMNIVIIISIYIYIVYVVNVLFFFVIEKKFHFVSTSSSSSSSSSMLFFFHTFHTRIIVWGII